MPGPHPKNGLSINNLTAQFQRFNLSRLDASDEIFDAISDQFIYSKDNLAPEVDLIDEQIQSLHIPIKIFEKQIDFIQNYYEIISIEDLSNYFINGGLNYLKVVYL